MENKKKNTTDAQSIGYDLLEPRTNLSRYKQGVHYIAMKI
jgi:hypothetical protein